MSGPGEPTTYWQALAVAADQGHLFLNEEAAQQCYTACDTYIQRLRIHQEKARVLSNVSGWGDFDMGLQLQDIFAKKAVGGENNMVDVLQSHIDVVEEMKVVFNKFFTSTHDVDKANAAGIKVEGPR
ncbi:hypothetical protein [Rhodococcoides fascians]|uniref:hypothetical protein n=1 Tax=Rhodococcoides fascians TaxID=1828 RepID=UPI00055EF490|nr:MULTISPECIES: hypothetical protein [Rhodococcus]OZE96574.1 hypothetical protein CH301_19075 [Rhodococcus sp. 15-1189-1-1a]OZF11621.1 hypothetical protein CH299_19605 [Rhodococcus sp. 14-2686-1-2]